MKFMRRKFPLLILPLTVALGSGCAFYAKEYVSEIELEGTNYRGKIFDDGAFYVNAEPSIRLRMGCFASTQLGQTMSLLIPLPILNEIEPHDSIASRQVTLELSHQTRDELDLSDLPIAIAVSGTSHPLRLAHKDVPQSGYQFRKRYEYAAELTCAQVQDGVLTIGLEPGKVRRYGVHFKEGVKRKFAWHSEFVT